jgi:ribosomal protein S27AE
MTFIERQTSNLKELLDTAQAARATPDDIKTVHQRQQETVVLKASRCPRCGNAVYPLFPVPVLCGDCHSELLARDQQEAPGCHWWAGLLNQVTKQDPAGG